MNRCCLERSCLSPCRISCKLLYPTVLPRLETPHLLPRWVPSLLCVSAGKNVCLFVRMCGKYRSCSIYSSHHQPHTSQTGQHHPPASQPQIDASPPKSGRPITARAAVGGAQRATGKEDFINRTLKDKGRHQGGPTTSIHTAPHNVQTIPQSRHQGQQTCWC